MTFSITARCPDTGMLGVAVSTKLLCVGALCPYVRAGVGAISSQSFVNPYIGINGIELLANGLGVEAVRDQLAVNDEGSALRQFSIVDAVGNAVVYSGTECVEWFGERVGQGYAAAGNMLVGEATITAMADAYEHSAADLFPERLMRALEAGQQAGGDKRGRQSAALKVAHTEDYPLVDLRVDDHAEPVAELRRLWGLYQDQLASVMSMLPTKAHPAGQYDLDHMQEHLPAKP